MFTLRFESDSRASNDGGISHVVEASTFRTQTMGDGSIEITFPESNETHVVDGQLGGYDRCFVMNAGGATVAQYRYQPKVMKRGVAIGGCGPIGSGGE